MIKVEFKTKAKTKAELRTAFDIKCAERGVSRATVAQHEIGLAPYVLNFMFKGITDYRTHIDAARKVCEITGMPMSAWDN